MEPEERPSRADTTPELVDANGGDQMPFEGGVGASLDPERKGQAGHAADARA